MHQKIKQLIILGIITTNTLITPINAYAVNALTSNNTGDTTLQSQNLDYSKSTKSKTIKTNNIPWQEEKFTLTGLGDWVVTEFRYNPTERKLDFFFRNGDPNSQLHWGVPGTFIDILITRDGKEIGRAQVLGTESYKNASAKLAELENVEVLPGDKITINPAGHEIGRFRTKSYGKMDLSGNKFVIREDHLELEKTNGELSKERIFIRNSKKELLNILYFDAGNKTLKSSGQIHRNPHDEQGKKVDGENLIVEIIRDRQVVNTIEINQLDNGDKFSQEFNTKINGVKFETGDQIQFSSKNYSSNIENMIFSKSYGIINKFMILNNTIEPVIGNFPYIEAPDEVINVSDSFDEMQGVIASDVEDENIASKVTVTFNNLDTDTPGEYYIQYEVVDTDGNVYTTSRKITVKSNGEIVRKVSIGTYDDFTNMTNQGLKRGNDHGKEPLGIILPANTKIEVRQVPSDFKYNLILSLLNDNGNTEKSVNLPNNGAWVEVSNTVDSVPFVKKPMTKASPQVEYKINGNVVKLPTYKENGDEKAFFKTWDASDAKFAFIENSRVQMLVPKTSKNYLKSMRDFGSIDELFEYYNWMFDYYDGLSGLEFNAKNPIHRNVETQYFVKANKSGGGAAYYAWDHTAFNGDNINEYLSTSWLVLHEIGHGYENNIGNHGLYLTEVYNNILSHLFERQFRDENKGWLYEGDRKNLADKQLKQFRENGKGYNDTGEYRQRLAIMMNFVEFIGEDAFTEFNKLYRERLAAGKYNGVNTGTIFNELFSEVTGYDVREYFEIYKIFGKSGKLYDEDFINYKNIFILGDVVGEAKAEEIRAEKGLKSMYSLISTEEILTSKVKLDRETLKVNIDNIENIIGETVTIKDGEQIIAEQVIKDSNIITFDNLIPAKYTVELSNKNSTFENYFDVKKVTVISGKTNTVNLEAPYKNKALGQMFNQKIVLNGLGDWTFASINTDLDNNKLIIKTNNTQAHSGYGNQLYATIEVLDENKNNVYKKDFIGADWQGATEETIELKPGYTVNVYHAEPWSRRVVYNAEGARENEYQSGATKVSFTITDLGLDDGKIDFDSKLYKVIEKEAKKLEAKLGDNVENYKLYRNHRAVLQNAFDRLSQEAKVEFVKNYGKLINKQ